VYDQETGLYYLQTRYYDPELGRFISADSYASTGQGFAGCNMFAYCLNNPVRFNDPYGRIANFNIAVSDGRTSRTDVIIYYLNINSSKNMDTIAQNNNYSTKAKMIAVSSYDELRSAFDDCTTNVKNIYLYLHGDSHDISFYYNMNYSSVDITSDIPQIDISGQIYLFSCHGAQSVGPALAEATGENVVACNQGISFTKDGLARCGIKSYVEDFFLGRNLGWDVFTPDGYKYHYSNFYCDAR
jgi:RHS repeat-associated protein